MSEKMPQPESTQIEAYTGYDPSQGLSYKEYLEQGGEMGQDARNNQDVLADNKPPVGAIEEMTVRPVRDGELVDNPDMFSMANGEKAGDGAVASMANEPWTLDVRKESQPDSEDKPGRSIEVKDDSSNGGIESDGDSDNMGTEVNQHGGLDNDILSIDNVSNETESDSSDETRNESQENNTSDTPQPGDSEVKDTVSDVRDEGYKKVGEAVSSRIDELEREGETSTDAFADAHDEFWGIKKPSTREEEPSPTDPPGDGDPSETLPPPEGPGVPFFIDDGRESVDPPGETGKETEVPKSPELLRAEESLVLAREEYARLKAGRESSTFFSLKYSKSKVETARIAYEEAKANAGRLAVEALTETDATREELMGAVNFGSAVEEIKFITEQFKAEQSAVENRRFKGFYEWWNKQSGVKGMIKKGAAMALIGLPIGIGVGIIGAPVFGGAGLAGVMGLAASRSISRGLVGNTIRRNADASSVAETKALQREQEVQELLARVEDRNEVIHPEIFDSMHIKQTKESKLGNDKRAAASIAIAAGSAVAGAMIFNHFWGGEVPKPGPPTGGVPKDYVPEKDWDWGIRSTSTDAGQRLNEWYARIAEANPTPKPGPELVSIRQGWDTIKDQISNGHEARVFNRIVGRLSQDPAFGNSWTSQHMDTVLNATKEFGNVDEAVMAIMKTATP